MILITRPKDEAKILKKELSKIQIESAIDSLTSFAFIKKEIPYYQNISYLISSAQTVKFISKSKKKYQTILSKGNFFVIGKKVAADLRKLGTAKIKKITDDSEKMLTYLKNQKTLKNNSIPLIYLFGSVTNKDFLKLIKKNNDLRISRVVIYKTLQKSNLNLKTIRLINQRKISLIPLYSLHTAQNLMRLIKKHRIKARIVGEIKVACLSARIAQYIKNNSQFTKILVSKRPNQNSMISLIKSNSV